MTRIRMLDGRKILLGVSGSIAAYKAVELASQLTKAGALVEVILSQAAQAFVDVLIEMRERMMRGAESANASLSHSTAEMQRPMWFFRRRRREFLKQRDAMLKSLTEGYMINLDRIEDICRQYEISEIDCTDTVFDPLRMKAVALDDNDALPEGTVVEVFSKGYLFSGRVHRPAEVKVVRHMNRQTTPNERI